MPLKDNKGFIKDSRNNLSVRERNGELGARLSTAAWGNRKIYKIDRVEIGAKGWYVHYRTGTP